MYKTLVLPNSFVKNQAFQKVEKKPAKKITHGVLPFLTLVIMMLNAYFLVSYMTSVNLYSSKGYEIKKIQQKIASLDEVNKKLSKLNAENTSMVKIQEDFLNSNFVAAGTAKFVETSRYTKR